MCAIVELFGRLGTIPYALVREGVAYLVDEAGESEYAAFGRGWGGGGGEQHPRSWYIQEEMRVIVIKQGYCQSARIVIRTL